jgi:hypothetical protein
VKELEEIKDLEESKGAVKETKPKVITVFGSSRPAEGHGEYAEAVELGRVLAEAGFAVCTGGYAGVMEGVSRGAREAGGRVLAVTSSFFSARGTRCGLGDAEQEGHGPAAVCGSGRLLAADLGAGARSRTRSRVAVGRVE